MIYFIRDKRDGVKVGYAHEPLERMASLQTGSSDPLELYAAIDGDETMERELHGRFALYRLDDRREWFKWSSIEQQIRNLDRMRNMTAHHQIIEPQMADDWLRRYHYSMQRPITRDHVRRLAREMEHGRFEPTSDIFLTHLFDQTYLINGQHQLHAVVLSNLSQAFCIREFRVYHPDRVRDLYWSYDRNKSRRFGDVARCFEVEQRTGLTNTQVNKVSPACALIHKNFRLMKGIIDLSDVEKVHMVLDYGQAAMQFFGATQGADPSIRKALLRRSVVALGLVTFNQSPQEQQESRVLEFWHGLAENDGLRKGDPRKVIFSHLASTVMPSSATRTKDRRPVDDLESVRVLAACWNAWVDGRELWREPGIEDSIAPIVIRGTRWQGDLS